MRVISISTALLALGLATTAPLAAQDPADSAAVRTATEAAEGWLRLLDAGLYEESWDSAATAFREAVTRPDWVTAVTRARMPFEPFQSRTIQSARYTRDLPNTPPGEYVIIQYAATVAEARTVVETVVPMKDAGGRWRAAGYFVRAE